MSLNKWTSAQFLKIQKIAARHDRSCSLRLAIVTGDDQSGTLVCNCNGKLNVFGKPKTRPREQTLADVMAQIETEEAMTTDTTKYHGVAIEGFKCGTCGVSKTVTPVDLYLRLARELMEGRQRGTMTEEQDDELTSSMDPLWWAMTQEERDKINNNEWDAQGDDNPALPVYFSSACPFCSEQVGGSPMQESAIELRQNDLVSFYQVVCPACGANGPRCSGKKEDAVAAWGHRIGIADTLGVRVTYDKLADAAYIYLKDIQDGEAVQQLRPTSNILLDLDHEGRLIGIEVLQASKTLPTGLLLTAEVDG